VSGEPARGRVPAPSSARAGVAVGGVEGATTDRVRLHVLAGAPLPDGLVLTPRVQRAVSLAKLVGAPILPAIDAAAEAEEDAVRGQRAVAVATAQSRTVANGLTFAPLLLVPLIGRLAGVDVLTFYRSPAGQGVLLAGLGLLAAGGLLARLIVGRVLRASPDLLMEEAVELTATAIAGGAATPSALRAVAAVLPLHGDELRGLALDLDLGVIRPHSGHPGATPAGERLREVLATAAEVGAPSVPTLRRVARDLRGAELARVMAAAERLPAQLTFPTTLLLLPATLLLVGAPLVAAGFAQVLA
jgi:hypothetical protein